MGNGQSSRRVQDQAKKDLESGNEPEQGAPSVPTKKQMRTRRSIRTIGVVEVIILLVVIAIVIINSVTEPGNLSSSLLWLFQLPHLATLSFAIAIGIRAVARSAAPAAVPFMIIVAVAFVLDIIAEIFRVERLIQAYRTDPGSAERQYLFTEWVSVAIVGVLIILDIMYLVFGNTLRIQGDIARVSEIYRQSPEEFADDQNIPVPQISSSASPGLPASGKMDHGRTRHDTRHNRRNIQETEQLLDDRGDDGGGYGRRRPGQAVRERQQTPGSELGNFAAMDFSLAVDD